MGRQGVWKDPNTTLGVSEDKAGTISFSRHQTQVLACKDKHRTREQRETVCAHCPRAQAGPKAFPATPCRPLYEHSPPSTSSPPSTYLPTLPLSAPEQAGQTYMAAGSHQSKDQRSQLPALQSLWTGCRELRQRPRERPGRGAPGAGPQHPATTCQQPSLEQRPQ